MWSPWGSFSCRCCSSYTERFTRTCTNPAPKGKGLPCKGKATGSAYCARRVWGMQKGRIIQDLNGSNTFHSISRTIVSPNSQDQVIDLSHEQNQPIERSSQRKASPYWTHDSSSRSWTRDALRNLRRLEENNQPESQAIVTLFQALAQFRPSIIPFPSWFTIVFHFNKEVVLA